MAQIRSFRDLIVWQKSMKLVTEVYLLSKTLPRDEQYGLVSQIRRSAVSIPSNIAEGYGRGSTGDYVRFLLISRGSLYELQTQLEICLNLEYIVEASFQNQYEKSREVERMLSSLIRKIEDGS